VRPLSRSARKTVRALLSELAATWRCPGLLAVTCVVNERLTGSLGRYRSRSGVIELSAALLSMPWRVRREVVVHEAAHAALHLLHGPTQRPHGVDWAALMATAGLEPRRRVLRPTSLPASMRARAVPRRYAHRCPVCQFTRIASRPVRFWRCPSCLETGLDGDLLIDLIESGNSR
jgi:predicted SprT family Zn-dependent metalloprotease